MEVDEALKADQSEYFSVQTQFSRSSKQEKTDTTALNIFGK